jgi:hypothetical protein
VLATCHDSFECVSLLSCFDSCAGDGGCSNACTQAHPTGVAAANAVTSCVLCQECPVVCGATCP